MRRIVRRHDQEGFVTPYPFHGSHIQLRQIHEDAVAQFQALPHQDLLPARRQREIALVRDIVDILDGHQLLLHGIEVVDQGAVARRPEKRRPVLFQEGLVVQVHGHRIGRRILEGETHIVTHAVFRLIGRLHFGEHALEKGTVLRRDRDRQVDAAVLVPHIGLALDQMLGESGPALTVRIAVELDHALRLGAVSEAGVGEDLFRHAAAELRRIQDLRAEEIRRPEREAVDGGRQLRDGRLRVHILPFFQNIQTREDVLEHTGRRPGSRHELAAALYRKSRLIRNRSLDFLLRQHTDPACGSRRRDDLQPGEAFLETFDLRFDLIHN